MPASEVDTVTAEELESLMREFPDWKEQFPDIYTDVYPQRFSKLNGKKEKLPGGDARIIQKRSGPMVESDYSSTFRRYIDYRPRSTKRPPPTPPPSNPPPMSFETFQRSEFKPKDLGVRASPVKIEEQLEKAEGRMEGTSNYRRDYPTHRLPAARQIMDPQIKYKPNNNAKFHSETTANEHFRPWKSSPSKPYGELPCFTGSILYPGKGHQLETTSGATFQGALGRRSDAFNLEENLKIEGDLDLVTTHNETYHRYDHPQPAQRHRNKDTTVVQRGQFRGISQTQCDYPGYGGHQPAPPAPAEPAPATIDLKFNNRQTFVTEQRKEFPGVDARQHPAPKLCKKDQTTYKKPAVKFETNTSQKMDYLPIHVEFPKPQLRPPTFFKSDDKPKFDDRTMSKEFFRKWNTEARVIHGDLHEGHRYEPPTDRFTSKTTNQDVFLGETISLRPAFKPEDNDLAQTGGHDFNTMYRKTYNKPMLAKTLTRQQADILLRELRQRKGDRNHMKSYPVATH